MRFLVDAADIEEIRRAFETYPLSGVTTNPSSVARQGLELPRLLPAIREVIGADAELHVQVTASDAPRMVRDAYSLSELAGPHVFIKVPVTREGIKAMRQLVDEGFAVTATSVFAANQAFLAGAAGVAYVAPYVNRLDEAGGDGETMVRDIATAFATEGLVTVILAASFRDVAQVERCCLAGAGACTLPPALLDGLVAHPLTEDAVARFERDWVARFGSPALLER
ncbi:MAG: fructose-6-phosphate aldolase [Chloroflexi bacterium]|nr:fructose-6-phosphate aldolase [Chloroflexota bacterium]